MASRFSLLILLPILSLLVLSLSADARPGFHFHPCKTLIVSTYSFSLLPENPNPNPNPNPDFIVVADFRPEFFHHPRFFLSRPRFAALETPEKLQRPRFPAIEKEFSSFRDRTKDILSVVASLLFGAACGALTAGTMYLVWSLFTHTNEYYRSLDGFSSSDDDEDDDEDIFNPKKKGYVAIPAAAPAPAKESA